jgi:hypothetical protein
MARLGVTGAFYHQETDPQFFLVKRKVGSLVFPGIVSRRHDLPSKSKCRHIWGCIRQSLENRKVIYAVLCNEKYNGSTQSIGGEL